MNKTIKIAATALFMMCSQFFFAQQTDTDQQFAKQSKENHKRFNDRVETLKGQQQQIERDRSMTKRSAENQKMFDDKISLLKKEQETAEAKERKLTDLENNLNLNRQKLRKLQAVQDAEYRNNAAAADANTLKQRAAMKENVNNVLQETYKQEAEINKVTTTP